MVNITELLFYDEFTGIGASGSSYLLGSPGDMITAKLTVEVNWQTLATPIVVDGTAKTITLQDKSRNFINDGFKVNDTFRLYDVENSSVIGYFTISAITSQVITVTETIGTKTYNNVNLNGTTTVLGFDYKFNLIENSDAINFQNIIDTDTIAKYNGTGWGATGSAAVNMTVATRSQAWVTNSVPTIQYISNSNFKQKFTILHTFKMPEFLSDQLSYLEDGQPSAPSYYLGGKCLKYICDVDAKFDNLNPTPDHKTAPYTFSNGNNGYFGEFLNGGTPEYTLTSIVFTDVLTGLTVTEVDFNRTTDVVITLASANAKFVAGATPFVLNHLYLPLDSTDYKNTTTNYKNNFKADRKKSLLGAASSNGEEYGTDIQAITNLTTTYTSTSSIAINYRINIGAATRTALIAKDSGNRNFLIYVTPQASTVTTTKTTDRNAIVCYVGNYIYDQKDSSLFSVVGTTEFYDEANTFNNKMTGYSGYEGDVVLTRTTFKVPKTDANIWVIAAQIIAEKSGEDTVILETTQFDVADLLVDCNGVKDIDITQQREWNTGLFKEVYLKRLPTMDDGTYAYYQIQYPFKLRYEDWRVLDTDVACFPEPKQNWSRYSRTSGWATTFNIIAGVEKISSEYITYFRHSSNLNIYPKTNNSFTSVIHTYTESGTDLNGQILSDANTVVTATVYGDFATFPASPTGASTYYGALTLDNNSVGGVEYARISHTEYDKEDGSPWLNDNLTMTVIDNYSIQFTNTLDYTKLDNQKDFILTIRSGYKSNSGLLLQENLFALLQENGQGILIT